VSAVLVVEFNSHEHNYLTVDEEPYFVLHTDEKFLVTQDRCPHRGGPLHLGEWNCHTRSLACPWHGTCLIEPTLNRRSVPAVRSGQKITAMVPVSDGTLCEFQKRMVLANATAKRAANSP
jgi:nitrite reductase (NADH) small subunit